ncbi:MAG: thiamine pyrophosphate-dependent enzyme [Vampirovibrionales bacterium]
MAANSTPVAPPPLPTQMAEFGQTLPANTIKPAQMKTYVHPEWCPGCGDFGILNAVHQAITGLGIPPWEVQLFAGIGCSGRSSFYVQSYGVHTLHGRVLPYALGGKMINPKLTVIAAGGDGDGYGIGAGHFLHAGRRNVDVTYIVFNNEVYGLTKGQASPTLAQGAQPKSLPAPNINQAINPLAMAVNAGYTFVARSYAFDAKHLKKTLMAAIEHRGMAIVDILQPCPTYNDIHTKDFFSGTIEAPSGEDMPRTYYLEETGYNGVVQNPSDEAEIQTKKLAAIQKAYEVEDRIPLGIYYQVALPTFEDRLKENIPALREHTPIELPFYDPETMEANTDLSELIASFTI